MATSGNASFNMDFMEIAEEAWERAGREMRSGYDLRTARRSMNLLTIEWANRGINMWTIAENSITLGAGDSEYALADDGIIDIIEHFVRENAGTSTQSDLSINRISVSTYAAIPNKKATGRPLQIFVERLGQRNNESIINVWPVPDKDYTLCYFYLRRIEDATNTSGDITKNNPDMSFRFLPCLVAGLAYYIAMKEPELMPRVEMLKAIYEEQFAMAAAEDREKTSARFVPSIGYH